jgi:hypothetical protein
MGQFIDSFDTVVRFNAAQAGGKWERDFGKKTDILFSTQTFNPNLKPKQHIFFIPHIIDRMDLNIQKVYKYVKSTYNINPTTGFMSIFYFLEFFDKVNIINFDFQIGYSESGKNPHYYPGNDKPDTKTHSFEKERDIITTLPNVVIH